MNRCGSIAIIGRPNVGKSTLLNRLLGQKLAITSHKAQTTRHAILGIKTRPDGQLLFVDTPGIHQRGQGALNRYLNRAARVALADVDVALFVVEALRFTAEDIIAFNAITATATPAVVAINKTDLVANKTALLPYLAELAKRHEWLALLPVSARSGDQLDALELALLNALPAGENLFPDDQLTDRSERFLAAELLREQLVQRYGDELPYHTTVGIERFEDRAGHYHIHALIWVERDSQKAIIVGQRGAALKAAATQARLEMQKLFDCPVRLNVWVRVKKSWSSNEAALAQLGYSAL
ncbi:GTPase Era [Rhodoferax sp. 4810]|uniref:GTPase Era n=1 Tax=Thiospirillum jenense TaxID=1653858 RepID=A0A839HGV5_9GAMM|nr:GTPase Era [Thiospirillum jenense]MBB1074319.1 GTPase Era [Rhodoferax jenense]MBB1126476.1 GTPase Era [Thiospirillum jenense]